MANWNTRMQMYRERINSLQNQGWLTASEASAASIYQSDSQFNRLIELGKGRSQAASDRARQQTSLSRVGGLPKPGATLSDDYYKRFAGISKSELDMFQRTAVPVKLQQFKAGSGIVDKYTTTVPDVDHVVRERYMAAYDPTYANKQLQGNRQYEIQSKAVDKYINEIKNFIANAYQTQNPFTPKVKQQAQYKKASRASFGNTGSPSMLSNMSKTFNQTSKAQTQSYIRKTKPLAVGKINKMTRGSTFFSASKTRPLSKATPKKAVRAYFN